jgi:hypothetical protein
VFPKTTCDRHQTETWKNIYNTAMLFYIPPKKENGMEEALIKTYPTFLFSLQSIPSGAIFSPILQVRTFAMLLLQVVGKCK